jgi:hypothetical protein
MWGAYDRYAPDDLLRSHEVVCSTLNVLDSFAMPPTFFIPRMISDPCLRPSDVAGDCPEIGLAVRSAAAMLNRQGWGARMPPIKISEARHLANHNDRC